jgi:Putative addiction module component
MESEFSTIVEESLALDRETRCDLVDQLMFSLNDVPTFWDQASDETTEPSYWLNADEISKIPMSHYVDENDADIPNLRKESKENIERVMQKSLGLTVENRILLHRKVLASLRVPDPEFDDWTYKMLKRRSEEIKRGEVKTVDAFEMIAKVREMIRSKGQ